MKKTNLLLILVLLIFTAEYSHAQFCAAGPSSGNDSNIEFVQLVGDAGTAFNYVPPCPGIPGVDDQTALSADLTAGTSYSMDVTWGTCGGTFGNSGTIWIDWNQNFTFEASEVIHTFDGTPTVAESFNFTIPVADGVNGAQRMRVMQWETFLAPPLDPCGTYSWGSVIDLTINISGATGTPAPIPYCSSGPTSAADSNMGEFSMSGESSSINYTPPCPGMTGLDDQTALSADLLAGGTYSADVTWATCGGNFGNGGTIWIDYDQNSMFDPSEAIHNWDGTPTVMENFSFTVPVSATGGSTTMRAKQQEGGTSPLDPCGSFSWGSVVDFTVEIIPPCDDPTAISVDNITDNSASVNFNSGGNNSNVEITAAGAGQGTGTVSNGVSSPYPFSGLSENTSYDVYVQNDCGLLQSAWVGPTSFTTLITPKISIVDSNGNGLPNISDPCNCGDPDNIEDPLTNEVTYFHDFITVVSNPGETWELTSYNSGQLYDNALNPIAAGASLTEVSAGLYRLDGLHQSNVGFDANFNRTTNPLATALTIGNNCNGTACIMTTVPTMGEWGMIIFALIMLSFGVVYVMRQQIAMAGVGGGSISAFNNNLPFEKATYKKALIFVMIGLAATFALAVSVFGYEMTNADVPGSLLASPVLAYLIHLVILSSKKEG